MVYAKRRSKIDGSGWGSNSNTWQLTKEEVEFFKTISAPTQKVGLSFWYQGIKVKITEVVPMCSTREIPTREEPKQHIYDYFFSGNWAYKLDKSIPVSPSVRDVEGVERIVFRHDNMLTCDEIRKTLSNQNGHKKASPVLSVSPSYEYNGEELTDIDVSEFKSIGVKPFKLKYQKLLDGLTTEKYLRETKGR
jgi:hypothetical protein